LVETREDGPTSTSSDDGSYELELEGSGRYWLGAWAAARGTNFWTQVDVPAVDDFPLDLSFPLGWIRGRVRASDGRPLAGIHIEAEPSSDSSPAEGYR